MKITDQRGTPTRFDDLDVGDYFYDADEEDTPALWRKLPVGRDARAEPVNSIHVQTAKLHCFTAESRVQAVEVEIFVTKNIENRTG